MILFNYIKSIGFLIIFLLCLFLLNPYSLVIQAGYAMVAALLIVKGRTLTYNIDRDVLVILAFSVTYSMFDYFASEFDYFAENRGIQFLIIQATFPAFFYALGKMMVTPTLSNKGVLYLILSIGFMYSISALLSIVINLKEGGFAQTNRLIPSFWTGKELKSTGMAVYLIYNSVIPAILVANRKRLGLLVKGVLLAIFTVTLIASFRLGSRTLLVISILSFFTAFTYLMYKQALLANIKLISAMAVLLVLTYLFVPFDPNSPIFSTLGHRLSQSGAVENIATAGSRTELWAAGLQNLVRHPLGWRYHMHHHNVWLDIAKKATIIPLFFFLVNNVFCYIGLKKVFSLSGNDLGLNATFLLIFLATYLLFFTEPIFEGNFFAIVVYCLLLGVMNGYIKTRENVGATENI